MLKKLILASAILTCSSTSLADTISAGLGFHGISIEYTRPFGDVVNLRFILSDFPFDTETEEDDIEFEIEYDRTNLGALVDYRPLKGSFHLTGGFFLGDHQWLLSAKGSSGEFELGENDTSYAADDLGIEAVVEFSNTAPYLGLGWGNASQGGAFTVNFDMGILFIGSPDVTYTATGSTCNLTTDPSCLNTISVNDSSDPDAASFRATLDEEEATVEEDLEDFEMLPILQLTFGYRF